MKGWFRRIAFGGTLAVSLWLSVAGGRAQTPETTSGAQPVKADAQPHSEQAYSLPPDKVAEAKALNRIRVWVAIAGSVWGLIVLWALLATGCATRLDVWTRETLRPRWVQGIGFFAIVLIVLAVADLPLGLIAHSASLKYHVSVQGWGPWFVDNAKGLGVSLTLGVPVALFLNWVVRRSPRRYWMWVWLISLPLVLISVFLAPLVLDPIFNKFAPLEATHPALVAKLEQVVARTGTKIPPSRMFLMKASEKSNGINAYVSGIGSSKRFVMWDTTMDRMPDDEIMFIFGHESGHYVLNHIPKGLTLMIAGLGFLFWACASLAEWMVRRFGERWKVSAMASRTGFMVLFFAFSVGNFLTTPIANTVSRHFEHEADVYGQEAVHGLVADPQKTAVSGFNHMGEAWLEDPAPNAFVEFWLDSHPSVRDRAKFAEQYDPWANGGRGEFFTK
ncbi:MAG: M48 family metallopeptidase [Acidobacteria bacterium]|nr:M48 family metallopeptidase [Acidobacteriota bacterium]